jgi:hypothetical protein
MEKQLDVVFLEYFDAPNFSNVEWTYFEPYFQEIPMPITHFYMTDKEKLYQKVMGTQNKHLIQKYFYHQDWDKLTKMVMNYASTQFFDEGLDFINNHKKLSEYPYEDELLDSGWTTRTFFKETKELGFYSTSEYVGRLWDIKKKYKLNWSGHILNVGREYKIFGGDFLWIG